MLSWHPVARAFLIMVGIPTAIAAVYYDYASNQGTVMVDQETYGRHFAESVDDLVPSSLSVYLRTGADVEAVRARLANSVAGVPDRLWKDAP